MSGARAPLQALVPLQAPRKATAVALLHRHTHVRTHAQRNKTNENSEQKHHEVAAVVHHSHHRSRIPANHNIRLRSHHRVVAHRKDLQQQRWQRCMWRTVSEPEEKHTVRT